MNGTHVLRAAPVDRATDEVRVRVTPQSAGWEWSGLELVELPESGRHVVVLDGVEGLLLPPGRRVLDARRAADRSAGDGSAGR